MKRVLLLVLLSMFLVVNAGYSILPARDTIHPAQDSSAIVSYSMQNASSVPTQETHNNKSQILAFALAILLGIYGIHNFYLGYKQKGMTQLIITLVSIAGTTVLLFIPVVGVIAALAGFAGLTIVWIWSLIDAIRIISGDLKPANGEYTDSL